jgi:hypothetical protein
LEVSGLSTSATSGCLVCERAISFKINVARSGKELIAADRGAVEQETLTLAIRRDLLGQEGDIPIAIVAFATIAMDQEAHRCP